MLKSTKNYSGPLLTVLHTNKINNAIIAITNVMPYSICFNRFCDYLISVCLWQMCIIYHCKKLFDYCRDQNQQIILQHIFFIYLMKIWNSYLSCLIYKKPHFHVHNNHHPFSQNLQKLVMAKQGKKL